MRATLIEILIAAALQVLAEVHACSGAVKQDQNNERANHVTKTRPALIPTEDQNEHSTNELQHGGDADEKSGKAVAIPQTFGYEQIDDSHDEYAEGSTANSCLTVANEGENSYDHTKEAVEYDEDRDETDAKWTSTCCHFTLQTEIGSDTQE